MDRPFLQTPEWMSFQESLGRKTWRLEDGFLNAALVRHNGRLGKNYLYVPYGPELNLDMAKDGLHNDVSRFAGQLKRIAYQEDSVFVRIEPAHDMVIELLRRNGMKLRKAKHTIQPQLTTALDLTWTVEQLMDKMHHKHRYNIGLSERKGVTVEESHDVDAFWKLLHKTAEHDDFSTHGMLYYKKLLNFFSDPAGRIRTKLYLAYHGGQPIAGVLMLECAKTVYYLHGASDREYRSLMAPHLLHWKLVQQYKQAGYHWYDFWGVDSSKWPGVTRFKLGFGGRLIEYPGAFDMVFKRFWYWVYKLVPR